MSSSHNVKTDGSRLSRLDQTLFRVEEFLNLASGLIILGVMFVAVGNIVGRYVGFPVPGYIDWMEQSVPAIAILGISYCQRMGGHIRMDIVIGKLKGRWLWFAELLSTLLMLLITVALIYGSWDHAARAIRLGDSTVDINLPTWPAKILFPIVFTILALRLLIQLAAYYQAIRSGKNEPVAVPLIEDATTVARREAETVSGLENGEAT